MDFERDVNSDDEPDFSYYEIDEQSNLNYDNPTAPVIINSNINEAEHVIQQLEQEIEHDSQKQLENKKQDLKLSRKKSSVARVSKFNYKNKKLRRHGKPYTGKKFEKVDGKITSKYTKVLKPAVEMKASCNCCSRNKINSCDQFSPQQRKAEFDYFWSLDEIGQRIFVKENSEIHATKRRTTVQEKQARQCERKYFLRLDQKKVKVCVKMFANTLGKSERSIRRWSTSALPPTSPSMPINVSEDMKEAKLNLDEYLRGLQCVPSHYCRASTSRIYLELPFRSVSQVFRAYKDDTEEKGKRALSEKTLSRAMDKMSISIYTPRKDKCDFCFAYENKNGTVTKEQYDEHIRRKDEARNAKDANKVIAFIDDDILVICVDVEAVLLSPCLLASALYYRTKLCVHNYTIFDMKTHEVTCFVWPETEGGLVSSVFATMLLHYIKERLIKNPNIKKIIIHSDGCNYQNRSVTIANALFKFAVDNNIIIEQMFLEKGHTQMEVDSVHSAVERQIKRAPIYVPFDYVPHIVKARLRNPYTVEFVDYTFFKDFSGVNYYSQIKPGAKRVVDIRCLQYNPNPGDKYGIHYKLNYSDDWRCMPHKVDDPSTTVKRLYRKQIPISAAKFKHLQEIKSVIPVKYWKYYDSLPHK